MCVCDFYFFYTCLRGRDVRFIVLSEGLLQNYLILERSRSVHKAQHNLREDGIFCCCCPCVMKFS